MNTRIGHDFSGLALAAVCAALAVGTLPSRAAAQAADRAELERQVRAAETGFARSMADRDHRAFVSWLAEDTVFLGEAGTLRGKTQVAAGWKRFYEGPQAPFSWEPDRIEVLDAGTLALSSGPVRDPQGRRAGTFNSVWRREANGEWRIVFDKGCPPCDCK